MGEVVVSSDGMEVRKEEGCGGSDAGSGAAVEVVEKQAGSPSGVVKWERFLPRMVLRVLLVEADDSTRQIIAALLRKCSYRGRFWLPLSARDFSYGDCFACSVFCTVWEA